MHHTSDGRAPAAEFPRPPTPAGGKTRPAGPAHSARPGRWRRRIGLPGAALLVAGAALIAGWLTGPAASAASTDLACGRPAGASSNTGTAGNAVDCVAGTVWQSATTKPQQLQVDLGATLVVDHLTVVATRAGTAAKPIALTGGPRAVLSDPCSTPAARRARAARSGTACGCRAPPTGT